MYEIRESIRDVGNVAITTYKRDVVMANIIEVEAGTNGYCGGDSGHGSRTYFRIQDKGSTDINATALDGGIEITLGGDSELESIIEALKFVVIVLEDMANNG